MAGTDHPTPPNKVFGITNIKSYIPLLLDLEKLNYETWRELFTTHCNAFDVLDHIDDTYDAPKPPPTAADWNKIDSVIKKWLYGTVSQALLPQIYKKDASARHLWLNIENLFHVNKDAKTLQVDSELRTITMGDLSVMAYCSKIKSLADVLANMDPASAIPDKHLVIYTINGLSSRFDSVASIIRYRSPLPSFLETRSMLLMEEQRLNSARSTSPGLLPSSSSPTVLHTTSNPTLLRTNPTPHPHIP